ncbi:UNVERIFIED_CONTAM: hypothetical protein PYX00_003044 [Menopon gallinae]|uniref:Uncharacterized protein n=1 Tax=Menopon gallinae TaxID=328185 RepID=A0AAW2HZ48_9NEOP
MFGNFVQRIQESFSPVTSPVSSPKVSRRRFKSPTRGQGSGRTAPPRQRGRRNHKDEYREVQSEPESDNTTAVGSRRLLDKRKGKSRPKILEISNPIPIPKSDPIYFSASDVSGSAPPCRHPEEFEQLRDEKKRNGFHYVNSVPNIADQEIYGKNEPRRGYGTAAVAGGRTDSRIEEFEKGRQESIYWNVGFVPLQGSKSLGRLDGIKESRSANVVRDIHPSGELEGKMLAKARNAGTIWECR